MFAVDWWESSGIIDWSGANEDRIDAIQRCQYSAGQHGQPVVAQLPGCVGYVHANGIGTGRQARLEFRIDFLGSMLAYSLRKDATRRLANFYLKVPGEACLIHGFEHVRGIATRTVEELGGQLQDEWIRRIDLCLDLPGVDLADWLQPAFDAGRFLSAAATWNAWDGRRGKTGFTVGRGEHLLLRVYDKLRDIQERHDEVYRQAMLDRRWGGVKPAAATRVEYQVQRAWLTSRGFDTTSHVLERMGDLVAALTSVGPYPFFLLTDAVPDRKGKHQGRVGPDPNWAALVAEFQRQAGLPLEPLPPLRREAMNPERALRTALSYLITIQARRGVPFETVDELLEVSRAYCDDYGITNQELCDKWHSKARALGTETELKSLTLSDDDWGPE